MELNVAGALLKKAVISSAVQSWADLGAGRGLFTKALSQLLPGGSSIIAIDKESTALAQIKLAPNINLRTKTLDFTSAPLDIGHLDGILMANSLHYVKDQRDFVNKLLAITNHIVIVEYDMDKSNAWIPYPVNFVKLTAMSIGNTTKIGTAPSQYHKEGIYSALISL